jgi:polyisoprenoid-binding protein YceI
MSRRVAIILGALVLIAVIVGVGALLYLRITGGTGEASQETISEQLEAEGSNQQVFRIDKEASEVRFRINEELRGNPKEVVGTTKEIAGDILVDYENPQETEIGTIRINMRTLSTDNEFRNQSIRGMILQTAEDQYEFSDFVVTNVTGLPESITIGEPFDVAIEGTLTLRGEPQPITFDATITPVSETEISGTASSVVRWADLGIDIPRVPPQVANIGDETTLELDFVARAVEDGAASATQETAVDTVSS